MIEINNLQECLTKRCLMLGGLMLLSAALFVHPLASLIRLSLSDPDASYLLLIPLISAWLLFVERRKIFQNISYDKSLASAILLAGIFIALVTRFAVPSKPDLQLTGYVLSLILFWAGAFVFTFGKDAWRNARFALLFLLLMVPWPLFLLDRVIHSLQVGSAWITAVLFDLSGVPALRDGFVFYLPRATIEIAKECSGIRSSMAVLILALLVIHLWLESFWKKTVFLASALFVMILKNGIRIATLTLLAMYVDPSFLYGKLHHEGGVVFFALGLLLLVPIFRLLRRGEASLPKNNDVPGRNVLRRLLRPSL
jgi:exosortase